MIQTTNHSINPLYHGRIWMCSCIASNFINHFITHYFIYKYTHYTQHVTTCIYMNIMIIQSTDPCFITPCIITGDYCVYYMVLLFLHGIKKAYWILSQKGSLFIMGICGMLFDGIHYGYTFLYF